ncbi:MAG: glycosyltransferase family 4 protein, partial [Acidobacteriaceae bacterium]|nr:glycosyltransferase family 4 protein [Acidobacteriaceae bacterium]
MLSTPTEGDRNWHPDWEGLNVRLQKTLVFTQRWAHPKVGCERVSVHIPVDTLRLLHEFRPDLIYSAELGLRTAFASIYRRMRPDTRLLVWADIAESTERGRGALRSALRRALRERADGFIVNGASGTRYMKSLGVPGEKLFTVPYATDVETFAWRIPMRRHGQVHRLVYAGQLIERKGLLPFVYTLCRWAEQNGGRDVEFRIAGRGPLRERLADVRTPKNVRLQLTGPVPYERLPEFYADADALAFPTFADSWGLVVNEAMASGL